MIYNLLIIVEVILMNCLLFLFPLLSSMVIISCKYSLIVIVMWPSLRIVGSAMVSLRWWTPAISLSRSRIWIPYQFIWLSCINVNKDTSWCAIPIFRFTMSTSRFTTPTSRSITTTLRLRDISTLGSSVIFLFSWWKTRCHFMASISVTMVTMIIFTWVLIASISSRLISIMIWVCILMLVSVFSISIISPIFIWLTFMTCWRMRMRDRSARWRRWLWSPT